MTGCAEFGVGVYMVGTEDKGMKYVETSRGHPKESKHLNEA